MLFAINRLPIPFLQNRRAREHLRLGLGFLQEWYDFIPSANHVVINNWGPPRLFSRWGGGSGVKKPDRVASRSGIKICPFLKFFFGLRRNPKNEVRVFFWAYSVRTKYFLDIKRRRFFDVRVGLLSFSQYDFGK